MDRTIRQRTVVLPGGHIEVQSDDLPAGTEVEVIVLLPAPQAGVSYLSLFGAGRGAYRSPGEADTFLRKERDSWEN